MELIDIYNSASPGLAEFTAIDDKDMPAVNGKKISLSDNEIADEEKMLFNRKIYVISYLSKIRGGLDKSEIDKIGALTRVITEVKTADRFLKLYAILSRSSHFFSPEDNTHGRTVEHDKRSEHRNGIVEIKAQILGQLSRLSTEENLSDPGFLHYQKNIVQRILFEVPADINKLLLLLSELEDVDRFDVSGNDVKNTAQEIVEIEEDNDPVDTVQRKVSIEKRHSIKTDNISTEDSFHQDVHEISTSSIESKAVALKVNIDQWLDLPAIDSGQDTKDYLVEIFTDNNKYNLLHGEKLNSLVEYLCTFPKAKQTALLECVGTVFKNLIFNGKDAVSNNALSVDKAQGTEKLLQHEKDKIRQLLGNLYRETKIFKDKVCGELISLKRYIAFGNRPIIYSEADLTGDNLVDTFKTTLADFNTRSKHAVENIEKTLEKEPHLVNLKEEKEEIEKALKETQIFLSCVDEIDLSSLGDEIGAIDVNLMVNASTYTDYICYFDSFLREVETVIKLKLKENEKYNALSEEDKNVVLDHILGYTRYNIVKWHALIRYNTYKNTKDRTMSLHMLTTFANILSSLNNFMPRRLRDKMKEIASSYTGRYMRYFKKINIFDREYMVYSPSSSISVKEKNHILDQIDHVLREYKSHIWQTKEMNPLYSMGHYNSICAFIPRTPSKRKTNPLRTFFMSTACRARGYGRSVTPARLDLENSQASNIADNRKKSVSFIRAPMHI